MFRLLIIAVFACSFSATAQVNPAAVGKITPTEQTPVHDPAMIKQGSTYYIFSTGSGIAVFSSVDLKNWKKEKPVFDAPPKWAVEAVPGFKGHIWAPDISYHHGQYYLYYSVSAFGKNTSCIGLTINKTLDPLSADYKWEDQGKIIQSIPGRDMWNAIDANLVIDSQDIPWLSFGSFWNGIKLVKLNNDLKSLAEPQVWHSIAARPRKPGLPDASAGNAAIEAPFIFKRNEYYYLFVSKDYCCRAEKSDYKVVVGRSKTITGPYVDKTGLSMQADGGSLLLQGDSKKWYGAGHNAVYHADGNDYIVYHGYDAADKGKAKLIIQLLHWDTEGWPEIAPW